MARGRTGSLTAGVRKAKIQHKSQSAVATDMAKTHPKFPNFRDAFCAYYRCRPEDFQKRAFLRAVHPLKLPFALPIYAFNKPFFAMDFGIIDSMGDARTETEYEFAMDELIGINRVERSIRRGLLGIRISGSRLSAMWKRLEPYVEPPVIEVPRPDVSVVPQDTIGRRASEASGLGGRELAPQLVRRLKTAYEAITSGVPVPEAAVTAGFADEAEFLSVLEARAHTTPSARWLQEQLQLAARVRELEADLTRMKSLLADQYLDRSRARPSGDLPSGKPASP